MTEIKDSGKGIDQDRIQYLFTPFGELRKKQLLSKVIDYGIGIGLSNSREMARYIGGDVTLRKSEPGCTIFQIIIPIFNKHSINSREKFKSLNIHMY